MRTLSSCVDVAKSVLSANNYEPDIRITTGPQDAFRFSSEAVASNADLVIAWGGDGTVNGAASGVAGTNTRSRSFRADREMVWRAIC